MVTIGDPWTEIPAVSDAWRSKTEQERRIAVQRQLPLFPCLHCTAARLDGTVILDAVEGLDARGMGELLRQLETELKRKVDPAICVYLEPQQDRNRLRLGRLEIKSDA